MWTVAVIGENFYCDLYEQQRIVQKVLLMAVPISWGDCHGELVIQWGKWQSFSKEVSRNFQFMTFSSGGVLLRIKCFNFYLLYNLINIIWINPITINYSTCVRGLDREWKSIIEYLGLCGPIYCFPFMYVKWLWSLPGKVNPINTFSSPLGKNTTKTNNEQHLCWHTKVIWTCHEWLILHN